MPLSFRLRRVCLLGHIASATAWCGAVLAYLALAISGLGTVDAQVARATVLGMEIIGWWVIVPAAITTLMTGLLQSLITPSGLIRHWWILVKCALTVVAVLVLFQHMKLVDQVAEQAAHGVLGPDARPLQIQMLVHPAAGMLVLIVAMVLSLLKPWGLAPYGRRLLTPDDTTESTRLAASHVATSFHAARLTWAQLVRIHLLHAGAIGFVLSLVIHVAGGGMHLH